MPSIIMQVEVNIAEVLTQIPNKTKSYTKTPYENAYKNARV
jgi:hypothetical protein